MPRGPMKHRSPGQNQGRRPTYSTPELAAAARNAARIAADARNAGKPCLFSACTRPRSGRSDLCSTHATRRSYYGHAAAGPIADSDLRSIARHIRFLITPPPPQRPTARRLDAQLVAAARATVERLVVAPGQRALPSPASALDRELHRCQHPPAPARPPLDMKTGQPIPTSKGKALSADEALVAALSSWCAAIIPGAVTRSKSGRARAPRFPNEKSIACLVGGAVLTRRIKHGGAVRGKQEYELGRQHVVELSSMIGDVAALVNERMQAS